MLVSLGIESELIVVIDNNDIDRAIIQHRPTHVIIEGLWVVPTKFSVLCNLHPTVKWIIRVHSELPFLAGEGMAMDWLREYCNYQNIVLAINAPRALLEIKEYIRISTGWTDKAIDKAIIYLPNFYPQEYTSKEFAVSSNSINIGCFGAVRPLKNHLVQAVACIRFADSIDKTLNSPTVYMEV